MNSRRPIWLVLGTLAALLAVTGGLAWGWSWWRDRQPPDHWDKVERGRQFLARGRPDLAFQAVNRIRDEAPGAAEGFTIAAQALLTQGQVALARKTLEHSLNIKPDQADAAKMLAAIYLAAGDSRLAVDLLQRASRLDPNDFRPHFALGKVRQDLGEFTDAAAAYATALKLGAPPTEARQARVGQIRALLEANRDDQARDAIDEALDLMPDDSELLGLAARHASHQGRSDEALALAERALAGDADNFDALLIRATENHLAGDPAVSETDLERALQINPNHLGVLQLLMQVQHRRGNSEQAEATRQQFREVTERLALMDDLTRQINERPDDPEPRYRMGQAAVEGGMTTLARQCFQAALDVDPTFDAARGALASLRISQAMENQPASRLGRPGKVHPTTVDGTQ